MNVFDQDGRRGWSRQRPAERWFGNPRASFPWRTKNKKEYFLLEFLLLFVVCYELFNLLMSLMMMLMMISYIPINISCCFVIVVDLPFSFSFSSSSLSPPLLFLWLVDLLSVGCFLHFLLVFSHSITPKHTHVRTKTPTQHRCCSSTPAATVRSMSLSLKTGEHLFICFFNHLYVYSHVSVWSCACIYSADEHPFLSSLYIETVQ